MSKVVEVDADAWEREVLQAEGHVVVDFWHHMCGWCIKLNPVYEQLPERYSDKLREGA